MARFVSWPVDPRVNIYYVLSHTAGGTPGARFRIQRRFNWLDDVVQAATGERFAALMTAGILRPIGLDRTLPGTGAPGYADGLAGLARPYALDEGRRVARSKYPPMGLHSSSGLSSTVLDLARYSVALDEHRLLSEKTLARAFAPTRSAQGRRCPMGSAGTRSRRPGSA